MEFRFIDLKKIRVIHASDSSKWAKTYETKFERYQGSIKIEHNEAKYDSERAQNIPNKSNKNILNFPPKTKASFSKLENDAFLSL